MQMQVISKIWSGLGQLVLVLDSDLALIRIWRRVWLWYWFRRWIWCWLGSTDGVVLVSVVCLSVNGLGSRRCSCIVCRFWRVLFRCCLICQRNKALTITRRKLFAQIIFTERKGDYCLITLSLFGRSGARAAFMVWSALLEEGFVFFCFARPFWRRPPLLRWSATFLDWLRSGAAFNW